jgi:tRNA threonylcarbamoyladenosine biosynthesis protein TsaE
VTYTTHSEDETIELGRQLGRELPRRAVVLLIGNLGAGKTALAKGMLDGMGVAKPEEVTSPTFTLIHEYGDGAAYHIDLYRLDSAREAEALGIEDLFEREAVVLIEWGERFPQLLPVRRWEVRIGVGGDEARRIEVQKIGGADRSRTDE